MASVATVHEQALTVDTATSRVPPFGVYGEAVWTKFEPAGRRLLRDPDAVVVDDNLAFPARQAGDWVQHETRPCSCLVPEVGDSPESQFAAVDTSHGHSGDVVTVTVPIPPSGPILEEGTANATWHFSCVGTVVTADWDSQPPTTVAALRAATGSNKW